MLAKKGNKFTILLEKSTFKSPQAILASSLPENKCNLGLQTSLKHTNLYGQKDFNFVWNFLFLMYQNSVFTIYIQGSTFYILAATFRVAK